MAKDKKKNDMPLEEAEPEEQVETPQPEPVEEPACEDAQAELERAQRDAAENLELAQRLQAELINYRKRVEREREESRKYAVESLVVRLIPVLDSLEQAAQMYADTPDSANPLLDGVRRTRDLMARVLGEHGVDLITQAGVLFDPNLHMPLRTLESDEVESDTVDSIYQPGIRMGDRVIRPATVSLLIPKALPASGESKDESVEEVE
jgi:molecular chaperone GrpE